MIPDVDIMMSDDIQITLLKEGTIPPADLTYVVIGARENDKWIFVRHRERQSWELPAGHIEKYEGAGEAAIRELYEETGTTESEMFVLTDYRVSIQGKLLFGRLFFAQVKERGPLPESEIGEIMITGDSPAPATYPEAHKVFVGLLETHIRQT
ncbi:MAG: NUDIX domain-containing protein [Bacteroidales bacterium]